MLNKTHLSISMIKLNLFIIHRNHQNIFSLGVLKTISQIIHAYYKKHGYCPAHHKFYFITKKLLV